MLNRCAHFCFQGGVAVQAGIVHIGESVAPRNRLRCLCYWLRLPWATRTTSSLRPWATTSWASWASRLALHKLWLAKAARHRAGVSDDANPVPTQSLGLRAAEIHLIAAGCTALNLFVLRRRVVWGSASPCAIRRLICLLTHSFRTFVVALARFVVVIAI